MKITDEREKDLHGRFMNPESIEKAPEGFTDNIMSAVRVGSLPVGRKKKITAVNVVPIAVLAIMLVLVIISALSGTDDKSFAGNEISKVFQNIALPRLKAPELPGLNLPGLAIYISLGIFVLWIFDLFLGKIFYRRQ
jgi:hypothetical protein